MHQIALKVPEVIHLNLLHWVCASQPGNGRKEGSGGKGRDTIKEK